MTSDAAPDFPGLACDLCRRPTGFLQGGICGTCYGKLQRMGVWSALWITGTLGVVAIPADVAEAALPLVRAQLRSANEDKPVESTAAPSGAERADAWAWLGLAKAMQRRGVMRRRRRAELHT